MEDTAKTGTLPIRKITVIERPKYVIDRDVAHLFTHVEMIEQKLNEVINALNAGVRVAEDGSLEWRTN